MNDDNGNMQTLVEYYRNKCSQLEFNFIQYQIQAEATIRSLTEKLESTTKSEK